jgi:hypothetical protein
VLHDGACTAEECTSIGGRPEPDDGSACSEEESSYPLTVDPPSVCCLP